MKKLKLLLSLSLLFFINANAQLITSFSSVKTVTQKGDITFAANAITTCTGVGATCTSGKAELPPAGVTNNQSGGITIGYIDIDGTTGIGAQTFSSSNATLDMGGIGGCGVIFAYLSWGGFLATGTTDYAKRDSIYLQVPAGSIYNKLKADVFVDNTAPYNRTYHCYKDVTALVKAAGPGIYTAANVVAATGGANQFAGWTLIVIYADNSKPLRNLTIFKGLAGVSGTSAVQFPISGFFTPPTPAPVNVKLGFVAFDGDRAVPNATGSGLPGDSLKFNGIAVSSTKNPQDDIFNSTITNNNAEITRNPIYTNTLGYDADIISLQNSTYTYLANSASSATLRMSSGGETILVDIVTTAIDVFEPEIRLEKSYNNLTRSNALPALPGDIIEFTIKASNQGSDPADNLLVTDSLYGAGIYVPNSMQIITGANAGAKTDAVGDDQMEYNSATNVVNARLGIGANGIAGGKLKNVGAVDSVTTFKFQVQISNDCEIFKCKDSLINMAFGTYKGQTSLGVRTLYSAASGIDANGCPLAGPVAVKIDVNPTCPPYADTSISACAPYNLSNILPKRPGFSSFFNSAGMPVTQATTTGIYYAVRTIYPGFTWLPACKDSIIINFTTCILPINLLLFNAKYTNNLVHINWTTTQEINNHHFDIERSINGIKFEKIAEVSGTLNSNSIKYYNAVDDNFPQLNTLYYRLKQVDINGQRSLSNIITVNLPKEILKSISIESVVPNPVLDMATVNIFSIVQNNATINIYDVTGKLIYTLTKKITIGRNELEIDFKTYKSALYFIEIIDNSNAYKTIKKIIRK
jgi:uncharacterized repeat protein (TIGR01451 family)